MGVIKIFDDVATGRIGDRALSAAWKASMSTLGLDPMVWESLVGRRSETCEVDGVLTRTILCRYTGGGDCAAG